jgi:hypothetical protein
MRTPKKPPNYPGRKHVEAVLGPVLAPVINPVAKKWAGTTVQRLLGFWVIWHTYGDLSALVETGLMSRTTAYRQRAEFVRIFGVNVEDFQPEVAAVLASQRSARVGAP